MNIGVENADLVKKNSNNFSFVKEVIDEVNNDGFKSGVKEFFRDLSGLNTPGSATENGAKSYIWNAISAVADDVGETLYSNVLNYIENVADIDTCTTKALQSMVQILGTKYSILDGLSSVPQELIDLIDVFSMRRECLLSSKYVSSTLASTLAQKSSIELSTATISGQNVAVANNQSIAVINNYRHENLSDNAELSTPLSITQYVGAEELDRFMRDTFVSTIRHFVDLPYGKMLDDKPIREVLSNEILLSGFTLPNKYQSKIDIYKTKWHIPPEFNPEEEQKKIENGLSTIDDYQLKFQTVLSIEQDRESAPLCMLEPMTRYAYFKESKVKQYFKFIEDQYAQLADMYQKVALYELDNTYLDLTNVSPAKTPESTTETIEKYSLMRKDGTIQWMLVDTVVDNLMKIVHSIQDLREYLKSHAQRTYMKGTFLLISYIVNEYLKQNIYPALCQMQQGKYNKIVLSNGTSVVVEATPPSVEWDSDQNKLNLVEYFDQTQYYNLETNVDSISSTNYNQLNNQFWNGGSTIAGNAAFVDSTNLLKSEVKSQQIFSKHASLEQIAQFYESILAQPKNKSDSGENYVNGFLETVFETGADDSWWSDAHNKVMATLSDQTHTIDIEDYLSALSAAYQTTLTASDILLEFEPQEGMTVQQQLDEAKTSYISRLSNGCDSFFGDFQAFVDLQMEQLDDAISRFELHYSQFDNLKSRVDALFAVNADNFSDLVVDSNYLIENLQTAESYLINKTGTMIESVRGPALDNILSFIVMHKDLRQSLISMCQNLKYVKSIEVANDIYYKLKNIETYPVEQIVTLVWNEGLSYSSATAYEIVYDEAISQLKQIKLDLLELAESIKAKLLSMFTFGLDNIDIDGFDQLSALLGKHNFYDDVFSIIGCDATVASLLDYSDDAWYKYKKELFLKYTGCQQGKTPYYYLTNSVHPSYQIHPCLSNFMQKVDFSYPIKSLGGIADEVLKQQEAQIVDGKLEEWCNSKGYLKNAWSNPLNINTDYAVRYELVDHIDTNLSTNPYFGWDGFVHPKFVRELSTTSLDLEDFLKMTLSGYNLSQLELEYWTDIVASFYYYGAYGSNFLDNCDIKQYGLDQYGNSYILISNNAISQDDCTLWFRPKNFPFPVLAFAYADSTMEESTTSCCAFSYVPTANTKFKDTQPVEVKFSGSSKKLYAPAIKDFAITNDGTMLLANCRSRDNKDFVVFGKISQYTAFEQHSNAESTDAKEAVIKRNFLYDSQTKQEHLYRPDDSEMLFKTWFTQGTVIGAIYARCYSHRYDICVSKFDRQHTHLSSIASALISDKDVAANTSLYVDCDLNGGIATAYDTNAYQGLNSSLPTDVSAQYTSIKLGTNSISSYVDTTRRSIVVKELQVVENSIIESQAKIYKPMEEAGFLLAGSQTTLSGTGYIEKELKSNGMLKIQLAVGQASNFAGVDFKFVCPVRLEEQYSSNVTADSKSYHFKGSNNSYRCELSGTVQNFDKVHFFESVYNQYVAQETDFQYHELLEQEKQNRMPLDKNQQAGRFDYIQLAHYDVAKYLSVLKSEEDDTDDPIPLSSKYAGVIQPYMMLSAAIPYSYVCGYHCKQLSGTTTLAAWKQSPMSAMADKPLAAYETLATALTNDFGQQIRAAMSSNPLRCSPLSDYVLTGNKPASEYVNALQTLLNEYNYLVQQQLTDDYKNVSDEMSVYINLNEEQAALSNSLCSQYAAAIPLKTYNAKQDAFLSSRAQAIRDARKAKIDLGQDEQLTVSWIPFDGGIKLDFNAPLNLNLIDQSLNVASILPESVGHLSDVVSANPLINQRNRMNWFLNLDRPGEVGILNTYRAISSVNNDTGETTWSPWRINTWIIKNVSEGTDKPKFLLAKADFMQDDNGKASSASWIAGVPMSKRIAFKSGTSATKDKPETYLLAVDVPDMQFVSFE